VFTWLVAFLRTGKGDVKAAPVDGTAAVGSFINANIRSILVIKDAPADNGLPTPPMMTPQNELIIRYETDTKCLYIGQKKFKEWCVKNQVSYHETLNALKNDGVRVESVKKRMGKGMLVSAPPVNAILIDDTMNRVFDVESIVAKGNDEADLKAA
jgi:hypothetical protein